MGTSKKIIATLFFLLINIIRTAGSVPPDSATCKTRLPENINRFQPGIVPVISLDGNELYFDRKFHPDNFAGAADPDDVWFSRFKDGSWSDPMNIGSPLNTGASDVLFSLSPDGNSALIYGVYGRDGQKKDGFSISKRIKDKWSAPQPLNIKNFYNDTSRYYAYLTQDGQHLLLSLKRKDSFGKLDLYISHYEKSTDSWTEPLNLGKRINTPGNEESPFLAFDGQTLYFSSDGRKGLGGMDLFVSRRLEDSWTNWSEPENLGTGINTEMDDNSLYLTALSDTAYIVSYDTLSKRKGIYTICLAQRFRSLPYAILQGRILPKDYSSVARFVEAELQIIDENNSQYIYSYNVNDGKYITILPPGKKYHIKATSDGFIPTELDLSLDTLRTPASIIRNIVLYKGKPVQASVLIVYFIKDEDILSRAGEQDIVSTMSSLGITEIKTIKLIGHADESGSDEYNINLSKRRADNVARYIENLGVKRSSISIEAKGESQPISELPERNRCVEIYLK